MLLNEAMDVESAMQFSKILGGTRNLGASNANFGKQRGLLTLSVLGKLIHPPLGA